MFKLFKRLTVREVSMIVLSVLFTFLTVYLELEVPTYISTITELLQTPGTGLADLWEPGLKMIGLSFASLLSAIVVGFFAARIAASFTQSLRSDIFNRVLDYSQTEIKKFSIPSLLTRTTNDITQVQTLITMGLQVVTRGPIMAIWAMTKIIGKSENWLIAVLIAVIVNILLTVVLVTLAFPKQSVAQRLIDKLNSVTRESLTGIRVVRAYNAEDYQDEKFATANDEVTRLNLFINRLMAMMNPVMMGISSGLTLAIYWIGAYLIQEAGLQERLPLFSDMVVFMSYAMQIVIGFLLMGALFIVLPRTIVSAGRINEVLDLHSSITSPEQPEAAADSKGEVVFRDVSFRYSKNSEAVIEHVSFTAQAGDTVAFIGSTGSGKSTLVNLIPRFYDVTEGEILVDGVNVQDYQLEDLHSKVGYIPQKAVLFSGDIESNLDFGQSKESPLDEQKMWEALDLAQAKPFVQEKEKGLKAEVAQSGTNFSGGQRQRLAIARALARKPEILIFDDSFSALDYKTDRILRKELAERTQDMTKLIVAQRISTIMDADQILVLDAGKVVGQGTHRELLASNEVYQEIAYSQLSKEELENGK
ncbi:ABC transporter ATP-binding protein [Streptococcus sanguinis]|uniref:Multidrug resistance ABC transporter ATP-binding and permease protein n=1 Tax=Streptococcus sanguinis SK115 TaxID=888810 RepID=F0I7J2_STRSA|nr:ABC transporter ATP-binding protein [Streptococcus sanguinis]EGD32384.1 multidrug resistance ABC transporter ATP-binding and permease protein [Streptococcus sanguinis SK115]MBZ2052838.1 ABC transporter ATP-binding protein/permease [Streptococcus sanguinis]MCY7012072.1 ABC transporter ATP-binding protein/permease [Streptococcus sanguinis]